MTKRYQIVVIINSTGEVLKEKRMRFYRRKTAKTVYHDLQSILDQYKIKTGWKYAIYDTKTNSYL